MMEFGSPTIACRKVPKYLAIVKALTEDIRLARLTSSVRLPPRWALAKYFNSDITIVIRDENGLRLVAARKALRDLNVLAHPCGHHLWLRLPGPWRCGEFGARARQLGLSVILSNAFTVGPALEAIRISLGATPDTETLQYGLRLLATLLSHPRGTISTIV
ncbi:hypothetical protein ASF24_14185 [Methylobacterium sp. Leaf86]|uniref:hypothetical protein n=1 Tax=Methylobacterium sp. Leaf86 TaxID=1736242 RepID=UPI00071572EC|nr:hypothetical protein ASF24_14185 [Methylobacterium sp. Leaf86]